MNEPNLPRLLSWLPTTGVRAGGGAGHPRGGRPGGRGRPLPGRQRGAPRGVRRHGRRPDRRTLGPRRPPSRPRRPDLPVGLSLAIVDDQVRGRPGACATASGPRSTTAGSSWPATTTSSACRTTSGPGTTAGARSRRRTARCSNQMGSDIYPPSLAGAVRYAHETAGVPVLVTEHGLAHADDRRRATFLGPVAARPAGHHRRRRTGARLPALDAAGQLRMDLRVRDEAGPGRGRPHHLRPDTEAERGRLRRDRPHQRDPGPAGGSPLPWEHR